MDASSIQRGLSPGEIEERLKQISEGKDFDIKEFIQWQSQIREIEAGFRTMGPEFEFARIQVNPSDPLPLHVDLAESESAINGLPTVVETDAGNVIEIALPPFVIASSMDDWQGAQLRSMIITEKIETMLKTLADKGAKSSPPMDLETLLNEASRELGIPLRTKGETFDKFKKSSVLNFVKGVDHYTNDLVGKEDMTNSQINLKMSIEELGKALIDAKQGNIFHMSFKNEVNDYISRYFRDKDYSKERIAILSFYIAQIRMMALQNVMNEVRNEAFQKAYEKASDKSREGIIKLRHENREAFKRKHPNNQTLLKNLSNVKDFMGFWIKASLNDMIQQDPVLKDMIKDLDTEELKRLLIEKSNPAWQQFRTGLEAFKNDKLEGQFEQMLGKIVDNMTSLAQLDKIPKAEKIDFPHFGEKGTNALLDFAKGTPFMVRPDTNVSLGPTGVLVEVRGLNNAISRNGFMRSFQMPFFRLKGKLAGMDPDWFDIYQADRQLREKPDLKAELTKGIPPHDRASRKKLIESIQAHNKKISSIPLGKQTGLKRSLSLTNIRRPIADRQRKSSRERSNSNPFSQPIRRTNSSSSLSTLKKSPATSSQRDRTSSRTHTSNRARSTSRTSTSGSNSPRRSRSNSPNNSPKGRKKRP